MDRRKDKLAELNREQAKSRIAKAQEALRLREAGLSDAEIGAIWDVSRQRVNYLINSLSRK